MKPLTDKLSSEQRDWIMELIEHAYINRKQDNTAKEAFEEYIYERRGYRQAKYDLAKILNANTAEDEPCSECGGNGFIWNNMGLPVDCPKCMMLSNFEGVDG